jgi:hypothetical protein
LDIRLAYRAPINNMRYSSNVHPSADGALNGRQRLLDEGTRSLLVVGKHLRVLVYGRNGRAECPANVLEKGRLSRTSSADERVVLRVNEQVQLAEELTGADLNSPDDDCRVLRRIVSDTWLSSEA